MSAFSISAKYVNTTKPLLILPRKIPFRADSDGTTLWHVTVEMAFCMSYMTVVRKL